MGGNKVEWTGKTEIRQAEVLREGQECQAAFWPTSGDKKKEGGGRGDFHSFGFSPEGFQFRHPRCPGKG